MFYLLRILNLQNLQDVCGTKSLKVQLFSIEIPNSCSAENRGAEGL